MKSLSSLKSTAARFAEDRSGNFALTFAAAAMMIMAAVGFGLDMTQMVSAKSGLSQALDAALLSTSREVAKNNLGSAAARAKAEKFLTANLNGLRLDPASTAFTSFRVNPADNTISATVKTSYALDFPMFGMNRTQDIAVSSAASYSERKVEVSMVLDVTGSMGDPNKGGTGTKINDLKVAARAAVNAFINNGSNNARVAIVPYSSSVNSGVLSGAVRDPRGNAVATDKCATERRGGHMYDDVSPNIAKVTRADEIGTRPYWICPEAEVRPLTRNTAQLNATINSLSAIGSTAGHIGLQWGWYMLSPRWSAVLPAASTPVAYGTANTEKYLIIMTDGMFNTDFANGAAAPVHAGVTAMSGRYAMGYCDAIKASGVKVFTIGFDFDGINNLTERNEAIKTLQDCASAPSGTETTFFRAESQAELIDAFEAIAKRVERVALVN